MNRYNLSWRDHLSFRYATRQSKRDAIRNALLVVLIVALSSVGSTIDYQVEQRIAAERQLETESAYAQTLRDCMSGAVGFYFPDTRKACECKVMPL